MKKLLGIVVLGFNVTKNLKKSDRNVIAIERQK